MSDKVFFDTNVLLYAHLCQDENKKGAARKFIDKSLKQDNCYISTQVIQEFCNNMLKKAGATEVQIGELVHKIEQDFNISLLKMPTIKNALNIKARYGFSFWDSLIVAAAAGEGCKTLYTEDLGAGQVIGEGLTIKNPFKE